MFTNVEFMSGEIQEKTRETVKPDDEISLIDLFAVLWQRKSMIIIITMLAAALSIIFSLLSIRLPSEKSFLPNVYTPEAVMLIDNKSSSGNSLSSMLSNMGGLASLAGLSASGGSSNSDLAIFLVGTNSFLDSVVDEFNLIERYKIKPDKSPRAQSRKALKELFKTKFNEDSGVLTISFKDRDPVFARDVVNYSSAYLQRRFVELGLDRNLIEKENLEFNIANTFHEIIKLEEESRNLEQSVASPYGRLPAITTDLNRISMELEAYRQVYTQLRAQYEVLKVTIASETPIFQVLEMAEAPDQKSGPSRGLICIIVTFAAGLLSMLLAFALNAVSNIRKDPEVMAKFRGSYDK